MPVSRERSQQRMSSVSISTAGLNPGGTGWKTEDQHTRGPGARRESQDPLRGSVSPSALVLKSLNLP